MASGRLYCFRDRALADNTNAAVTYGSYLRIDELLSLQQPRSAGPEHDEMLFIIIHQVYELWFKELLHEFDSRDAAARRGRIAPRAAHAEADPAILKVMVAQLDILETMTPLEFLTFRERLDAASGFQSDQFRQIEFLLGVKSEQAIQRFPAGGRAPRRAGTAAGRADVVGCLSRVSLARTLRRAASPARATGDPNL